MPALSIFPVQTLKRSPLISSDYEDLWSAILSQDEEKIKGAVKILDQEANKYVNNHLKKMLIEENWHPAEQASVASALQVIKIQFQD